MFDPEPAPYTCPASKPLVQYRCSFAALRSGITKDGVRFYKDRVRFYRAKQSDCQTSSR